MAAAGLLALLDDVAILTKAATRKTAGVLGDDLALNAQQVSGVRAERELPVVWAVAKGSLVNKAILVPSALAISAFAPWLVTPLLMIGGAFLCYEGFEKLAHRFLHSPEEDAAHAAELAGALVDPAADLVAIEKDKIKGAIRTDFVLSAEIIAITLGTVASESLTKQTAVLVSIALIMTVGVYGFVAAIVKLDDGGLALSRRADAFSRSLGRAILAFAPMLMKLLTIVGTAAMFLVGGGILVHGVPLLAHAIETAAASPGSLAGLGGVLKILLAAIGDMIVGVVAGALVLGAVLAAKRVFGKKRESAATP